MRHVLAPTGEDPESKWLIEDDSVVVAVDPFNPSLHIKKKKGIRCLAVAIMSEL